MGTIAEDLRTRKPRFLCLHGFRTSGEILRKQVGKWPESVLRRLDLVFVDGKFPAMGKSDVEGVFEGPYFEWFQFNKDFTEYTNFDECLQYIEECMIKFGPIDGFLGFSQGAILSAALPAMQEKGKDDFLRPHGTELLKSFVGPFIIHHPKGHTVPRIDDQSLPIMLSFLDKIEKTLSKDEEETTMEIAIDALEA